MNRTSIEWTEYSWNPVTGCTPVSPGCANCYARRIYERFHRDFTPMFHPEKLKEARKLPPHSLVFVNSTSDLFHENIAFADINAVFNEIRNRPDVIFQILTKRPERALEYSNLYMNIPYNAWIGVSVENRDYLWRIDVLRQINAVNRFVSFEPLIGPVGKVNLEKIKWVIVGGESGPKHREMNVEWVREIRDQAIAQNIPFFFKQWGGPRPGGQAVLDGREWKEYPKGMILGVKE
jgi:protein gp37